MPGLEDPALALFQRLEQQARPSPEDLDQLVRHVLLIARPGISERARSLLERWRRDGCRDPDLRTLEVLLTVVGASSSAWHRLQAIGDRTPAAAALEAISSLFRGELQTAVDLAYAHGWFLDSLEGTEVFCYSLMAAVFLEQYEPAEVMIDAWKRRFAVRSPEKYQQVLQQLLETIAGREGFALGVDELYGRIWGGPYDPLVHEGKVHVSIHRLRRWLDQGRPGSGGLLEVRDGIARFGPAADIRVLQRDGTTQRMAEPATVTPQERILQCLLSGEVLGPRELQRKLGVSRSSLNQALRVLVADGHLLREGRSRATRYRRAPP